MNFIEANKENKCSNKIYTLNIYKEMMNVFPGKM